MRRRSSDAKPLDLEKLSNKNQIVSWSEVRKKFNFYLLQLKTTERMNGLIRISNKWMCQNERLHRNDNASLSDPKSKWQIF